MRILAGLILCLIPGMLFSQQIKSTASTTSILIGDHVAVEVLIQAKGRTVKDILLNDLTEDNGVELVDPGKLEYNESEDIYTQNLLVTSFDSGQQYIPEIGAIIESSYGFSDTIFSNKIPLNVTIVPPDSLGLAPVKDIIVEEKVWTDYLIWFLPVLLVCAIAFVLWAWQKRRKKAIEVAEDIPLIPAHIEAIGALDDLEKEALIEQGEFKRYESQISQILRRYLERKFAFPALEWTTREIANFFNDQKWEDVPRVLIDDTLSVSDLVKYAKSKPGEKVHAQQAHKVRQIVSMTKTMNSEEE